MEIKFYGKKRPQEITILNVLRDIYNAKKTSLRCRACIDIKTFLFLCCVSV